MWTPHHKGSVFGLGSAREASRKVRLPELRNSHETLLRVKHLWVKMSGLLIVAGRGGVGRSDNRATGRE